MIVLFSHVRTGRWASVMPAKLAETLGLTEPIRVDPDRRAGGGPPVGLVVPHARAADAAGRRLGGRGKLLAETWR